jgi:hypothetical protein
MSRLKYFDAIDAEHCWPLDVHYDNMRLDGVVERRLYIAKPIPTSTAFWCRAHGEVGGVGDDYYSCGRLCASYAPRNGKNGRCRHHTHCYEPGESVVVRLFPH